MGYQTANMHLTCPCCAARFSIEAAFTDEAARQAVAAALKLPAPLGDLILRYLALFRPDKRALSWDRAAKLLTELLSPIQVGQVERHGRLWAAPLDSWRAALEQMLERRETLQLPLKGHGYLFEIVAAQANRTEGKAETKREDDRAHGMRQRRHGGGPVKVKQVIDKEAMREKVAGLKEALK